MNSALSCGVIYLSPIAVVVISLNVSIAIGHSNTANGRISEGSHPVMIPTINVDCGQDQADHADPVGLRLKALDY